MISSPMIQKYMTKRTTGLTYDQARPSGEPW